MSKQHDGPAMSQQAPFKPWDSFEGAPFPNYQKREDIERDQHSRDDEVSTARSRTQYNIAREDAKVEARMKKRRQEKRGSRR